MVDWALRGQSIGQARMKRAVEHGFRFAFPSHEADRVSEETITLAAAEQQWSPFQFFQRSLLVLPDSPFNSQSIDRWCSNGYTTDQSSLAGDSRQTVSSGILSAIVSRNSFRITNAHALLFLPCPMLRNLQTLILLNPNGWHTPWLCRRL